MNWTGFFQVDFVLIVPAVVVQIEAGQTLTVRLRTDFDLIFQASADSVPGCSGLVYSHPVYLAPENLLDWDVDLLVVEMGHQVFPNQCLVVF